MADDIAYNLRNGDACMRALANDESFLRSAVLLDIEERLLCEGKAGETQRATLPDLDEATRARLAGAVAHGDKPREVREELNYDHDRMASQFAERYAKISKMPSQKLVVDDVLSAMGISVVDGALTTARSGRPFCAFVDAPGGTGKTYCFNAILSAARAEGKIALAVASSGIAAILLEGGRTLHSRFKAPFGVAEEAATKTWISARTNLHELVKQADLIVWDEAPMNHKFLLEGLDRTLRDLAHEPGQDPDDLPPFAGKVVLLGGDFRQVLPVSRKASRAQVVASCLSRSALWKNFAKYRLTENMRVMRIAGPQDRSRLARFADWLLRVGEGVQPVETDDLIDVGHMSVADGDLGELIDWVYNGLRDLPRDSQDRLIVDDDLQDWFAKRAILAPRNATIDDINETVLDRLPGDAWHLNSVDQLPDDETTPIPTEYLNAQAAGGLPLHELKLKRGMPIMLLRNINPREGLCNGTRLLVERVRRKL